MMPRSHSASQDRVGHADGFTLIEMVITIVLLGILAAVGSTMISDSFVTTRWVNASNASEGEARYVLERLAREIREVKHISTGYCITTMGAAQIIFYKRVADSTDTSSCGTSTTPVDVNFTAGSSTLAMGYSASATTANLTNKASSFTLSYYKSDGSTAASAPVSGVAADVAFVQITLTVTDSTSNQSVAQRLRVSLRNS